MIEMNKCNYECDDDNKYEAQAIYAHTINKRNYNIWPKIKCKHYFKLSQRLLVIFVIVIQEIVDLTELKTQTESELKFNKILNNTNRTPPHRQQSEQPTRWKLSPTKIRIYSTGRELIDNHNRKFNYSSLARHQSDLSINNKLKQVSQRSYGNEHKKLLSAGPAYEFWPDVAENRLVLNDEIHALPPAPNLGMKYELDNSPIDLNIGIDKSNKKHRNHIPRPLEMLSSQIVSSTNIKLKSLLAELSGRDAAAQRGRRQTMAENGNENAMNNEAKTTNDDASDERATDVDRESENEIDDGDDDDGGEERGLTDYEQNPTINFKAPQSGAKVLERAESRRLTQSPIYPPGDPEILYSDALLVYVKDFNQYVPD